MSYDVGTHIPFHLEQETQKTSGRLYDVGTRFLFVNFIETLQPITLRVA